MSDDEPPIGALVADDFHAFLRRRDGRWWGCVTCGDQDTAWSWEEVRADMTPWYRVVLP